MTSLLFVGGLAARVAGATLLVRGASLPSLLTAYTVLLVRRSGAEPAAAGPDGFADQLQPAPNGRWEATLPAQIGLSIVTLGVTMLRRSGRSEHSGR